MIESLFDIETIIGQLEFRDICVVEPGRYAELRLYAETEEVINTVEQVLAMDIDVAEQVKEMFQGFHIVCFLENESFFYTVVRHFTARYFHPFYEGDGVMTLMGLAAEMYK